MKRRILGFAVCLACIGFSTLTALQDSEPAAASRQTEDETDLVEIARTYSNTMKVGGSGWQDYESYLHADFTRWSVQASIWNRTQTVDAIKAWWEEGNRLSSSEDEIVSAKICGDTGVLRKKITETYVDKEGAAIGSFEGYVTQVWVRTGDQWKLLAVTIENAARQSN